MKKNLSSICLFDHNKLDEGQAKQLGDEAHKKVRLIFDHHLDNNSYPDEQLLEKVVKFIGSATSIVASKIQ